MDSFKLKQLFKKYLQGKSGDAEEQLVENWYQKNDQQKPVSLSAEKEREVKDQIWMQIEPALQQETVLKKAASAQPHLKVQRNYTWMKIAASVLVILATGMLFYTPKPPAAKPRIAFSTISTAAGERKVISLSDGSSLTLNSASLIRIATDFSSRRNVEILDGEVFFEVKHDVKRPFVIRSGVMTTQVLGTSFNVRAYKELHKFSVGVTTGKVGVMLPNHSVTMLVKGKQLIYNKRKQLVSVVPLDLHLLDWQKGSLILNDASFEEMAVLIRKNFNITVSTNNTQIARKHFTATLSTAMTPGQAVEVIAAIHKRNIKKRRDTIEIY